LLRTECRGVLGCKTKQQAARARQAVPESTCGFLSLLPIRTLRWIRRCTTSVDDAQRTKCNEAFRCASRRVRFNDGHWIKAGER